MQELSPVSTDVLGTVFCLLDPESLVLGFLDFVVLLVLVGLFEHDEGLFLLFGALFSTFWRHYLITAKFINITRTHI